MKLLLLLLVFPASAQCMVQEIPASYPQESYAQILKRCAIVQYYQSQGGKLPNIRALAATINGEARLTRCSFRTATFRGESTIQESAIDRLLVLDSSCLKNCRVNEIVSSSYCTTSIIALIDTEVAGSIIFKGSKGVVIMQGESFIAGEVVNGAIYK